MDEQYQNAVKANDAATMARILADDFVLVTGRGPTFGKEDLLREARNATTTYERQDVETRTVRVWGDAAVVTALLWIKGVRDGRPIDYRLWFSDTYVRTPQGGATSSGKPPSRCLPTPRHPAARGLPPARRFRSVPSLPTCEHEYARPFSRHPGPRTGRMRRRSAERSGTSRRVSRRDPGI